MLSLEDRLVAERDPSVPGIALVLDSTALGERLNERLEVANEVEVGEALYVRYKPGTSCLCLHRMGVQGGSVLLHAVAFAAGSRPKLQKESTRSWAEDVLGVGMLALDGDVQVAAFPNDRRLRSLHRLGRDDRRRRLLQQVLGDPGFEGAKARVTTLSYKPQRRFVGRLDDEGDVAGVLKLYTRAGFERGGMGLRKGGHRGALRLPRLLGRSRRHRARLWQWIPGRSLADLLPSEESGAWLLEVGRALAELHALAPVAGSVVRGEIAEGADYDRATESVVVIAPGLAPRVRKLREELSRRGQAGGRRVQLHGDFYAKQVVVEAGEAPAVIDLDSVCVGEPELDIANFLAHLEADAIRGRLRADRVAPAGEALLAGYLEAGGSLAPARLQSAVAGALLRLAPHPFRRRESSWTEKTARLIDLAEQRLHSMRWSRMGNVA
jgi:hypothetical protein